MEKERTYRLDDLTLNRLGIEVDYHTNEPDLLRKLNTAYFSMRTLINGSATIKLTDREVDVLKGLIEEGLRKEESMSGRGRLNQALRALSR